MDVKNHLRILSNQVAGTNKLLKGTDFIQDKKKSAALNPSIINQSTNSIFLEVVSKSHEKIANIFTEHASLMNNFIQMYAGAMKKKYSKFLEEAQNLEHYKEKVTNLKTNCQAGKVQRNKNKLTSAQKDYCDISENIHQNMQKVASEGSNMLFQNHISSIMAILHLYDSIKIELLNSSIVKKQDNTEFFTIDNNEADIVFSEPDMDYPQIIIESLKSDKNQGKIDLKAENIMKYFNSLSLAAKNNTNIFDKFDSYQGSENTDKNSIGSVSKKDHFSVFTNILSHKSKKRHHELNQIKGIHKHHNHNMLNVDKDQPKSSKIKIKQVNFLDPVALKGSETLTRRKYSNSGSQYNSKNSQVSNKSKKSSQRPKQSQNYILSKIEKKESIDLLDLDI